MNVILVTKGHICFQSIDRIALPKRIVGVAKQQRFDFDAVSCSLYNGFLVLADSINVELVDAAE
jgi:hypothetical protein